MAGLSGTLSTLGTGSIGFAIILVVGLLLVGTIILLIVYLPRTRRYGQYQCTIWERDGFGQIREKKDKAGIFIDQKTKNKRFFLQKADVGLSPDEIPYIPTVVTTTFGSRVIKKVYLFQTGLKNFRFIRPVINDEGINLKTTEEDVNWALNSYERGKILFAKKGLLEYMPFILMAFVTIIILVIFIYFFKDFGVLADAANALKEASRNLLEAKSGTTVIQGLALLIPKRVLR